MWCDGTMEVRNITATTDLKCSLDLKNIIMRVPMVKYNPDRFSGLTMRIKSPKATAHLFSNGKMVCLGTKSEMELNTAGYEFTRLLIYLGYEVEFTGFTIKNMVCSCDVGFKLSLETMIDNYYGCIFEPEIYPALYYYVKNVTLIVFHTGKVIATGGKTKKQIDEAYNILYPMLTKCKK